MNKVYTIVWETYGYMDNEFSTEVDVFNDLESAEFCAKELMLVKSALTKLPLKQSALGKAIKDQPNTEFPQEILDFINRLEE